MQFSIYEDKHKKEVEELCVKHGFVNHFDSVSQAGVIIEKDHVIAYGAVRKIHEGLIALDQSLPKRDRVKALQTLFDHGMMHCLRQGINEWHVFVEDPIFKKILVNSYGFKECKGNGLIFQFGD